MAKYRIGEARLAGIRTACERVEMMADAERWPYVRRSPTNCLVCELTGRWSRAQRLFVSTFSIDSSSSGSALNSATAKRQNNHQQRERASRLLSYIHLSLISSAQLRAILLRNSSPIFAHYMEIEFMDTLEDHVLTSRRSSPVVCKPLLDVLAAVATHHASPAASSKMSQSFVCFGRRSIVPESLTGLVQSPVYKFVRLKADYY